MPKTTARIAGIQGFYGDSPMGAMQIVAEGAADYLMQDALAELTLSILQKDRQRDSSLGYARDIELLAKVLYPAAFAKGMKVVTNSGGLNPVAAGEKVAAILRKQNISGKKIAVITGDDVLERLTEIQQTGATLNHLDSGEPFSSSNLPVTHANVYVGAQCIKDALDGGADLILAGRVADPCLCLGILAHHFQWEIGPDLNQQQLNLLASGITAGHVLECGGQASGGNSYAEWPMDYPVYNLGYPIVHVEEDGSARFTKLESAGGKMCRNTVREQLVYEIHDPANYITPDVTVDLTEIELKEESESWVSLKGVKGKPRPEKLKLAIGQMESFITDQFFFCSWPYALQKARKFIEAAEKIWASLPVVLERTDCSIVGVNAMHGVATKVYDDSYYDEINELGIRVVIKHKDPKAGKMALAAITCLGLNGPPGVISKPGWGKQNSVQLGLWPTLIHRNLIDMKIEFIG